MDGRLAGKVIIVAGAGGIGTGLAKRYAGEGAQVVIGDIDPASAQSAADAVTALRGKALPLTLDGGDDRSIGEIVSRTLTDFGRIDGFHANYADFTDGVDAKDILGVSMDDFDQVMHVNMRGYVLCTRHVLPPMLAQGGGSIVYTSSAASWIGQPVRVPYAMSKLAIHALMRSVASRYGPEGIRANAVNPGLCIHERARETLPSAFIEEACSTIPLRRVAAPEDVAALCALLMSDEGGYITGQVLSSDGGNTMRQ